MLPFVDSSTKLVFGMRFLCDLVHMLFFSLVDICQCCITTMQFTCLLYDVGVREPWDWQGEAYCLETTSNFGKVPSLLLTELFNLSNA